MEPYIQTMITVVASVLASSGFWAYIQSRQKKKDGTGKLLIGIAHDRIIFLGMSYVRRGWLTQDEYKNLHDYLYEPYKSLGGNGTAERVMREVEKLEVRDSLSFVLDEIKEEQEREEFDVRMASGGISKGG